MYTTLNIRKEIDEIFDAISDGVDDGVIYDAYDDYSRSMLEFIKTKNKRWFIKLFNVIDYNLKHRYTEQMMKGELNIMKVPKSLINHLLMIVFNDPDNQIVEQPIQHNPADTDDEWIDDDVKEVKELKEVDELADDHIADDHIADDHLADNQIAVPVLECIDNFVWRQSQSTATNNQIAQGFLPGIHNHIMGAGKTFIILRTISDHLSIHPNKGLYIILCFRQEILRDMLFDEENNLDRIKISRFKRHHIIDMDRFQLIDRVNIKEKKIKLSTTKPSILIVNTDYFKRMRINYKDVNLVILDECHSVSAPNLYNELKKIKYQYKKHIIGFSATPLRKNAEKKLVDIFSATTDEKEPNKKLNIISTYDFVSAIRDNVILPPKYVICEVKKTLNHRIGTNNKNIMHDVLKNTLKESPYKKIIGWCRTQKQMREYYRFIKEKFPELEIYCSSCSDRTDETKGYNISWRRYIKKRDNCILLCVNRCREGSDFKNLDTAIYLDAVKSRSFLVALQTAGRVLRKDSEGLKTHGLIIDSFVNQDGIQIETMTAQRILGYYQQIFMLCDQNDYKEQIETYQRMIEMCRKMQYDENQRLITIQLSDNKKNDILIRLELKTKTYDFLKLKDQLAEMVDRTFGVDQKIRFEHVVDRLKAGQWFDLQTVDFWRTYDEIPADVLRDAGLPVDSRTLYDEYKEMFDGQTWYGILGLDTSGWYDTVGRCKNALKKFNINHITRDKYIKCLKKDKRLPVNPNEFFKLEHFTDIEREFSNTPNNNQIII